MPGTRIGRLVAVAVLTLAWGPSQVAADSRRSCKEILLEDERTSYDCPFTTNFGSSGVRTLTFVEVNGYLAVDSPGPTSAPAYCICKAAPPRDEPRFHGANEFVCSTLEGGLSAFVTGRVVGKGARRSLTGVQMLALTGLQTVATGKCTLR